MYCTVTNSQLIKEGAQGSGPPLGFTLGPLIPPRRLIYNTNTTTMPPLTQQEWTTIINDAIPSFLPPPLSPSPPPPPSSFSYSPASIAQTIDHTLLRLDATESQIDALCAEAIRYKFKSVCVRVGWVSRCVENLRDEGVDVCCVVGFHEGTYSTEEKVK